MEMRNGDQPGWRLPVGAAAWGGFFRQATRPRAAAAASDQEPSRGRGAWPRRTASRHHLHMPSEGLGKCTSITRFVVACHMKL